ncbi:unnamed protein product, partial [Effrenium voratum]
DDENFSVHSAISNEDDFAEDEEVDYLALELLHHLPAEKADKLMKSLRAKEKAVQVKKEEKKAEPVAPKETPKEEPKKEEGGIAETVADAAESVMDGLKALVGYGEEEKGDVVDVSKGMQVTNIRRQQSGKVVQHTATDVLVKYDDGKTEWAEIEDLKKLEAPAVGEDKGSPDVRVEGAGDTKAICSCGWL